MSLSLPKAHLIGYFVESFFYGVYVMILLQCLQILRRRRSRSSDYLIGTTVSLFILVTAHLVDDTIRVMDAFTTNTETPNYPLIYYTVVNTWRRIIEGSVYVTATIISDGFILYRSFIVWNRSYLIIAIPFMLFLADIAFGIFWMYALAHAPKGGDLFTGPLADRLKIFYAITLSVNIVCTCLIAIKIWNIQRTVAPFSHGGKSKTSRLVPIIVESCCIYSVFLVIMIATYSEGSMSMFIFLDPMCSLIGIVFSSLIVRVGSGLSHGDAHTRSLTTGSRQQLSVHATTGRRRTLVEQPFAPSCANHGIQVALSQTVHTHIDGYPAELEMEMASTEGKHDGFEVV